MMIKKYEKFEEWMVGKRVKCVADGAKGVVLREKVAEHYFEGV